MDQCINTILTEKWSLAYNGSHRFGHKTTNLLECMNRILKGGRNMPITALV